MLTITIDLHVDVIAIMLGILMPSLDGATNSQILRKVKHVDAILAAQLERIVLGTIIDHNVVIAGLFDPPHGLNYAILLVVSRHDDQYPWGVICRSRHI